MQYKILSANMLTAISLLLIMINLYDVQAVQPQNCICYSPSVLSNNSVACNTTHCSRGNNPNCNADDYFSITYEFIFLK